MNEFNCIVVLGPTASGKTHLACRIAYELNGEVVSADSRQVYQLLDVGTGKDLEEYTVHGQKINHHLIDLVPPSEQFYLHEFVQQLQMAFDNIQIKGKLPVICGGTGLYLDALHKQFSFTEVTENKALREELSGFSKAQLLDRLNRYPNELTAQVDRSSLKRILRGIELADYYQRHPRPAKKDLPYKPYYLGINSGIETRRRLISERLQKRLQNGLIEEVEGLLKKNVSVHRLEQLGLEYKFVVQHLQGKISRSELAEKLQTAIFQFAKRQMTWFRKMEKEGIKINWIDLGEMDKVMEILKLVF